MGLREKILWWGLLSFVFILPISSFLSVRLLVVVGAYSIYLRRLRWSNYKSLRSSWDLALYFMVLVLGVLYSSNVTSGLKTLESNFSLLGLPLVVGAVGSFSVTRFRQMMIVYGGGLILAGAICLINAIITYNATKSPESFFFYQLTDIIDSHPTYFAYHLICGLTVGLYFLFYEGFGKFKAIGIAVLFFLFLLLTLTGGQTAFVSLLLIFSFFILKYVLEEKNSNKNTILVIVSLMLVILFLMNSFEFWSDQVLIKGDYWERTLLWRSAISANPNVLIGAGTGDAAKVLTDYYRSNGLTQFALEEYNAHNQFIQIYLTTGLVGLTVFLVLVARPLYLSVQSHDTLAILVLFPFIIYGINEVFMGRYQGISMYAFLHELFVRRYFFMRPSLPSLNASVT